MEKDKRDEALHLLAELLRQNAKYSAVDVDNLKRDAKGDIIVFRVEDIRKILNMAYPEP